MAENIQMGTGQVPTTAGTVGLQTQVPGQATTVSGAAEATGGIAPGNFIEPDIDEQLYKFRGEDTPLMNLMLKSRKVPVNSPEVEHYMIDEQRTTLTTGTAVTAGNGNQFVLPLATADQNIPRDYGTLLVKGVAGYAANGSTRTPGIELMLFVTGRDATTNNPIVRAINGPKANASDHFCTTPAVPAGTKVVVMANALYETQKEVDPDLIVPQPTTIYLQKRGMNQVVSDYFEAQKKHIPFSQSVIAEQAIANFKRAGNRTLWAGQKGKMAVTVPKMGEQMVYFTEGLRWQFRKVFQQPSEWTFEKLLSLAKTYFTGEDVPKSGILFAGKNLLESLQKIDFSNHPEVTVSPFVMPTVGWEVTKIHTVFGDINIKREPTLDTLGWSNSGALIGEDRLVHYTYSSQHEFNDRVEGEEATRKGMLVWDAVALKGTCHIWIDGEGVSQGVSAGVVSMCIWDEATAPTDTDLVAKKVYVLAVDCPGINSAAKAGQMWQCLTAGASPTWQEYKGDIYAQ